MPASVRAMPLAEGDAGTAQTIAHIRQLVHQGVKSLQVNRTAIAAVWNAPQFSQSSKAQAIFDFVQQNFRFVSDMVGPLGGIETLRGADEILRVRAGDCDDFSVLIPSLLGTIGIRSRLVTIAHHNENPQEFSHIYPEAFADGRWIPMDVARPGAAFGRAPETYFRKRVWDLYSQNFSDVAGLSGYVGVFPRGLRGMGDDGFDWSAFTSAIAPITSGTAQIIAATRAAPQNIVASSIPISAAQQQSLLQASAYGSPFGVSTIPGWVWLLLGGGVLIAVLRR